MGRAKRKLTGKSNITQNSDDKLFQTARQSSIYAQGASRVVATGDNGTVSKKDLMTFVGTPIRKDGQRTRKRVTDLSDDTILTGLDDVEGGWSSGLGGFLDADADDPIRPVKRGIRKVGQVPIADSDTDLMDMLLNL